MGGVIRRNNVAWLGSSKSCSSVNLLLLILPLMVVAGLVSVWGPNPFNWNLVASQRVPWNSLEPSSSSLDLRSRVVVAVDDAHSKKEKAISDDTAFNHSSTPPLSVQAILPLQSNVSTPITTSYE